MKKRLLPLIALLAACGGVFWCFRESAARWIATLTGGVELGVRKTLQPDAKTYAVLVAEMQRWRTDLSARHRMARDEAGRLAVEHDARLLLENVLPEMMRCWLGTPWDFNGTAASPGAGRIACGYFVSTVLKDAGFQVDRYELAKQPSGNILRSFLEKEDCTLSVGKPYETFATETREAAPGIYLVGLDTHVGFLIAGGGDFHFIHSSGSRPWCVVEEKSGDAHVLQKSNWRMLGNLTADPKVIRRWLKTEKITVRGA